MRNGSRVADEMYKTRALLALEDFLSSLFTRSLVYQSKLQHWNSSDSCLGLVPLKRRSSLWSCFPISHYCYQYHLRPTAPVTDITWLVLTSGRLLVLYMLYRHPPMSASDLAMVSYATQSVATSSAEAPHWQIIEKYRNTAMQQDNNWSIAFEGTHNADLQRAMM